MIYLRQKPLASTFYKARGGPATVMGAIPRYKFMYYANFIASSGALKRYPDYKNLGDWEQGVSFKIYGIDKPNVELSTTELNQYNRKRYAYTKVEYQPLTVKMYDTVDDRPLELWRRYFTYYFGDSRTKGAGTVGANSIYNQSVVDGEFLYNTGWGLNPRDERLNFFDRIEIYAIYAGHYTQINYINPKITRVDWQNYDSSSSDPSEMSMTLKYETLQYFPSKRITTIELNKFGFDIEATYDPAGVPRPDQNIDSWAPRADIYDLFGRIRGQGLSLVDIANGISNSFRLANTTLNLFNQLPIGAFSPQAAQVIGQANQSLTQVNTVILASGQAGSVANQAFGGVNSYFTNGLVTNPAATSGFIGAGYTQYPDQVGGTLNQFGSFNFGNTTNLDTNITTTVDSNYRSDTYGRV